MTQCDGSPVYQRRPVDYIREDTSRAPLLVYFPVKPRSHYMVSGRVKSDDTQGSGISRPTRICLLNALLKMMLFILLHHALCLGWVLSLRHVRSCGCLKMIFGTRPHGHRPRLCSFVTFIPISLTSTTAKRSVHRLRHRSTQELVLD
jgi:hypothetical protein